MLTFFRFFSNTVNLVTSKMLEVERRTVIMLWHKCALEMYKYLDFIRL